ncbi:MAG: hypothetical protein MUF57_03125 [Gammaproteobacteria bacterium]|nr:hypothetical protein [Gammaproteobacteria bacterium]
MSTQNRHPSQPIGSIERPGVSRTPFGLDGTISSPISHQSPVMLSAMARIRPLQHSPRFWTAGLAALALLSSAAVAQQPLPTGLEQYLRQAQEMVRAEAAANDKVGGKWRGVPRIKGTATISYRTMVAEGHLMPSDERQRDEDVTARFELVRDDTHGGSSLLWRGHDVSLAGGISSRGSYADGYAVGTVTEDGQFRGPAQDPRELTLALDTSDGSWLISTPPFTRDGYTVTRRWSGQRHENNEWVPVNETETEADNRVQSLAFGGTIGERPGTTVATVHDEGMVGGRSTRTFQQRARIEFWPEYDDYTLEVRIDDYAAWRPLGQIAQPGKPGNQLTAKATVLPKGNAAPPQVRAIRFELLDVSREPGVCLNWPLAAKDNNPDLRLAAAPEVPGTLSAEDQKLVVSTPLTDDLRRPYALARIDSYDFGGRATLRVTAELLDGRELSGEFVEADGATAQDLIRLPKMAGPDWIAAAWKTEHGVADLPDTQDDEEVSGQIYDGDGFTLYEEYRGWVVAGKRVEGDPARKDFFVLNLIGADARKGIELFEKVSQLRVHSKLRRAEMSEKTRLMNGNHRDAPQRVKQHGVWVKAFDSVKTLGSPGAGTPMTQAGVTGRPGITVGIGILTRDHPDSDFSKPWNLPSYFSVLAWERAIAHELLHSVGVEHHGSTDYRLAAHWVSPRHPRNRIGRPYFREMGSFSQAHTVVDIMGENGHDLATQYMDTYARDHATLKQVFWDQWIAEAQNQNEVIEGKLTPEKYAENQLENLMGGMIFGTVGAPHGQHSGHQDCLMRYYFADLYPVRGRGNAYFLVTPGSEPFGLQLCRTKTGTGVNAASRKPQPRYGDAGPNGGDCFSQITPNDAIPPRKLP